MRRSARSGHDHRRTAAHALTTAAVDPLTSSVLVNNEDGYLYRWDLRSNSFTQRLRLTTGIGQAYTPTLIGADGGVYAINDAVLYCVGR